MLKRRPLGVLASALLLILFFLGTAGIRIKASPPDLRKAEQILEKPRTAVIYGVVQSSDEEEYGTCTILKKAVLEAEGHSYAVGAVRVRSASSGRFPCGWTLRAEGEMSRIGGAENPGQYDAARSARMKGMYFQMRKAEIAVLNNGTDRIRERMAGMRTFVNDRIRAVFPEDVSPLICAMLTGERSDLTEETRSLWQTGGIMHMLAISGLHLSILGMGLFHFLRFCRLPVSISSAASALFLTFYTVFAGCPVSAVRALVMFLMMLGAKISGRTYDPLTGLSAAALLLLLQNPEYLFYSAFQLSAWSVLLMLVFEGRSSRTTGLLLYLFMLPLVAELYFEIPLLGVPVNFLLLPVLPVILSAALPGLLLGKAVPAAAFPAAAILRAVNRLLGFVQRLPFAYAVTGKPGVFRTVLYFVLLVLWTAAFLKWRLRKRRWLLLFLLPLLIPVLSLHPGRDLKLTFLSVGQGDGICAQLPGGVTILTDSGSSGVYRVGDRITAPFLLSRGIRKLDYIVATHMDTDHVSGIRELLEMRIEGRLHMELGTLILPYLKRPGEVYGEMESLAARAGMRVLRVRKGDSLAAGGVQVRIWGPDPEEETVPVDENAQCVVMSLHFGKFDAMLTGDVCDRGEAQLIRTLEEIRHCPDPSFKQAIAWPFEVLKVSHHGSSFSTPETFLALLQPAVSVISCGQGNRYGHPHAQLLERLGSCGTKQFRTDECGAVGIATDGERYRITVFDGSGRGPDDLQSTSVMIE